MIRLSLATLVFLYLFSFVSVILGVWITSGYRRSQREKLALRFRLRCVICAFEFSDETRSLLPRCPRCGSLNERSKLGRL